MEYSEGEIERDTSLCESGDIKERIKLKRIERIRAKKKEQRKMKSEKWSGERGGGEGESLMPIKRILTQS